MEESNLSTKRSLKSKVNIKNRKKKSKKGKKASSKIDADEYNKESNKSSELSLSIKHRNNIKECLSHLELFFTDIKRIFHAYRQ